MQFGPASLVRFSDQDIEKVPCFRVREIADHGKGDILAKAIVVLQTSWFVIQCVARGAQGLILTELELVTLAFAALNVMTYILWWDKPLNVEYPTYFDKKRVDGPEDKKEDPWDIKLGRWIMGDLSWDSPMEGKVSPPSGVPGRIRKDGTAKWVWRYLIKKPLAVIFGPLLKMTKVEKIYRPTSMHPLYAAQLVASQHRFAHLCGSVIDVIFGAIHLGGWNFSFSTIAELWL
ncbi:hypothetical protein AX16_008244 [Volvariella volvacea WC 439]|nr:hypothetical protein AX16_008244 [Volvariella volvacea WC 439]